MHMEHGHDHHARRVSRLTPEEDVVDDPDDDDIDDTLPADLWFRATRVSGGRRPRRAAGRARG